MGVRNSWLCERKLSLEVSPDTWLGLAIVLMHGRQSTMDCVGPTPAYTIVVQNIFNTNTHRPSQP